VHCAGTIEGCPVRGLEPPDLMRVVAPKVEGLRAVLGAADPRRLKVVLAFGSILARVPHGNAGAYALANELLRREVDRLAATAPGPRYLTAEWSIWDGAGVAAESGAVAVARQAGYAPIRLAEGLAAVERLLAWQGPGTSVLISEESPDVIVSNKESRHERA
jgi:enediyne polyketide synthase